MRATNDRLNSRLFGWSWAVARASFKRRMNFLHPGEIATGNNYQYDHSLVLSFKGIRDFSYIHYPAMNAIDLKDKVALVTGGSGAIGSAIAKVLASAGSKVAVGYRDNEQGASGAAANFPGQARTIKGDVSNPTECKRIVETVLDIFGRVDILVNNAAIGLRDTFDTSYGEWQSHWNDTINANLMSAVNMTFCSIHHMRNQGSGKVINISSRSAFRGETEYIAYAATKAAMVNFTRCAARSLAKDNILVYAVAPGFIEAGMGMEGIRQYGDKIRSEIPSGKFGTPQDVANVVLFLASDLSDYITGSTIDVNGGSYLH